jgi:alkylation response protein AidB-like acyl-CoA dehydrogenase
MDFRPTDAQRLLTAVAREFLEKSCPLVAAPDAARETTARVDTWEQISALGWPGLLVPARFGGSEASLVDVVMLVEEMGRAACAGPYVTSAVVATTLLARGGTSTQQERRLPAMALGDRVCTLAIAESSARLAADAIAIVGDVGGRLDGMKCFVRDAHLAQEIVVVARSRSGFNLLLVDRDQPGVRLTPRETMAGDKVFDVTLTNVPITREMLIGAEGDGWMLTEHALALGAIARGAEMVGAAQRILELAVDHAKVRVQSGRPIGAFQAIQHACADLLRDVETARGVVHHAAWCVDTERDSRAAVATAAAYAASRCLAVARRAHQIFGAMGYSAEHPLHVLHKRIHAASVETGDRAAHLETVAESIGLR